MGLGLSVTGDSQWPFHPLVGGHLTFWRSHSIIPKRAPAEFHHCALLLNYIVPFKLYVQKITTRYIILGCPPLQDSSGILSGVTLGSPESWWWRLHPGSRGGPTPEVLASPTIGGITPWKGGRSCRDPFVFFFWGGVYFFSHQEIGVHELSMGTLNYRKLYLSNWHLYIIYIYNEIWLWLEVDGRSRWHTQVGIRFAVLEASLNDLKVWWNTVSFPLWKQGKSTKLDQSTWFGRSELHRCLGDEALSLYSSRHQVSPRLWLIFLEVLLHGIWWSATFPQWKEEVPNRIWTWDLTWPTSSATFWELGPHRFVSSFKRASMENNTWMWRHDSLCLSYLWKLLIA